MHDCINHISTAESDINLLEIYKDQLQTQSPLVIAAEYHFRTGTEDGKPNLS